MKTFLILFTVVFLFSCQQKEKSVALLYNETDEGVELAVEQLEKYFESNQVHFAVNPAELSNNSVVIVLTSVDAEIAGDFNLPEKMHEQGFCIRKKTEQGSDKIYVIGGGSAGTMYGGLELAEQIKIGGLESIEELDKNPYMNMRGIKFNIPLDVRTPSYSDMSDAAQENIAEMWSFDFWKDCIDNLALNRYNFISLWSLHPFPSMVKVPEYPGIALDDVQRSKGPFKEKYSGLGNGFDAPEVMDNVETLKKISIDEKIEFWKKVMRYAKSRNIDIYVVTWNIFTYGTNNQYGLSDKFDNPKTVDYFRKSVKQMFLTYPDLAGMGLTTGENMPKVSADDKEQWAFDTYGQGMLDAAKELPRRKMTMLHRQHYADTKKIAEQFQPLVDHPDINFLFSFKYAKAHVHSYTKQPFHQEFVEDVSQGDLKTIWTLRNDDTFYYRWGAPDFVREFIQNIPLEVSEGWYLGSDQWIWGREFLSTNPKETREVEVSKHWYHWMLWGRLGYDPSISNERFQAILQATYPEVDGEKLFTAWQEASMIYPKTTAFHWSNFDFQWYIEGAKGSPHYTKTKSGFHDVNFFIDLPPLESTNYLSIPSYVRNVINKVKTDSITPLEIARQIHEHVDKSRALLDEFAPVKNDDLRRTINDIRIISALGKYYAYKIEGATNLELFRQTDEKSYQDISIEKLNRAAEQWRLYVSTALAEYKNPLWTNRVGYVNWREFMVDVLKDVEIAGGLPQLNSMTDTPGGEIISASTIENNSVRWEVNIPEAGNYYAEIKYACALGIYNAELTINNSENKEFVYWPTGGTSTFAWDRIHVKLNKGSNEIKVSVPEGANIEIQHLNLVPVN
jgi:hypothetical protein